MLRLLVLYTDPSNEPRKTMEDHIFSFKRYGQNVECHYCHVLFGLPRYILWTQYDAVILHYSLLAMRWKVDTWDYFIQGLHPLQKFTGHKVALPQDEYAHTHSLCELFRRYGIETVFSLANKRVAHQLYPPDQSGLKHYQFTHPGFVDENTLEHLSKTKHWMDRSVEIGYRARDLPFWLGEHGQKKPKIGKVFQSFCEDHGISQDISTRPEDTIGGNSWMQFLQTCRFALGVSGGSSVQDHHGEIRFRTEDYVSQHPSATFEEVRQACFPEQDGQLDYRALSPRHFEYTMAGCCMILLEEDYQGILEPDIHYIPVKPDYSNLDEVWKKMQDSKYCQGLIENCRRDLIEKGSFTYSAFVEELCAHVRSLPPTRSEVSFDRLRFALVGMLLRLGSVLNMPKCLMYWTWYKLRVKLPIKISITATWALTFVGLGYFFLRILYHGPRRLYARLLS